MSSTFRWEDPPVVARRRAWVDRLEPAMAQPGKWAAIHEFDLDSKQARNAVSHLRSGAYESPPGVWEFRSSGLTVYAKYIGP
jgi:hypothetical protein